jgi:hypothetical protein
VSASGSAGSAPAAQGTVYVVFFSLKIHAFTSNFALRSQISNVLPTSGKSTNSSGRFSAAGQDYAAGKTKPAGKVAAKSAEKPAGKPAVKPAAKPAGKPAAKPAGKPAAKPSAKPAGKPDAKKPTGKVKPAGKTPAKPAGKPASNTGKTPKQPGKPGKGKKVKSLVFIYQLRFSYDYSNVFVVSGAGHKSANFSALIFGRRI